MNKDFIVTVIFVLAIGITLGLPIWYMVSSCSEKAGMDGYSTSKIVGFKCYGTNDSKHWEKVWF